MKTATWCGLKQFFMRTVIWGIVITDLAIDTLRFYMKHKNSRSMDLTSQEETKEKWLEFTLTKQ